MKIELVTITHKFKLKVVEVEFLQFRRREILEGKRKVSREDMERKVLQEYAANNTRRLKTPSEDEMIDGLPEF